MKGSSFVPLVICSCHQQTLLNLVYFIYLHNFHWLLSEQYLPNQSQTNQNARTLTIVWVTMPIVQVAYQKICCLSIIATTVLLFFHHSEIGIPPPPRPHTNSEDMNTCAQILITAIPHKLWWHVHIDTKQTWLTSWHSPSPSNICMIDISHALQSKLQKGLYKTNTFLSSNLVQVSQMQP